MKPNNGVTDIGIQQELNGRIGSLAALQHPIRLMSAFGVNGFSRV